MFLNNQRASSRYGSPINSHGIDKNIIHFLHLISIGHARLFHIVSSYMEILFLYPIIII
jgi:hypothetical protein